VFFDEKTGRTSAHDPIESVLAQSPDWAARVLRDGTGALWLAHAHGISRLSPPGPDGKRTLTRYRAVSEYIPQIQAVDTDTVAVSTGRALFLLDAPVPAGEPDRFRPVVVSARDGHTGEALFRGARFPRGQLLPYARNSLALRLFSGSYAVRRAPHYEFRLNEGNWDQLDGSTLALSNLLEGDYHVEVRVADAQGPLGQTTRLEFTIAPPWTRTWPAYGMAGLAAAGALLGLSRLMIRHTRKKNVALEQLVSERTEQLNETLRKLERETRTAATLAERNRLAGEIHDSLEQGFSALMLQLETTAGLPDCPAPVRAGLSLARSMVAFSRSEVRNAVWDLHSPRLDSDGLAGAIGRLIEQTVPASIATSVITEGELRPLSSKIEHHLLRIAQEAVANAVKHGSPHRIEVRLGYGAAEVRLVVADDGRGFDPAAVTTGPSGRFGLKYLRSRAAKIDGRLEICSQPSGGTRITISVTDRAAV
jgi:signal transduction histidine kinase